MKQSVWVLSLWASLSAGIALASDLNTNEVALGQAPAWLKKARLQRVIDRIENQLEWDIRKVRAHWYFNQGEFEKLHGFGPSVLAFTSSRDHSIHLGPRVDDSNFDSLFGHELAHVILWQKYKDAIPRWLEEGLANTVSKRGKVDYPWLASQPPRDVTQMNHPYQGKTPDFRYHYMASTALMEFFASRCRIQDLLQLSVGKKLETYLKTFCGISDLNGEFRKWVERKARSQSK